MSSATTIHGNAHSYSRRRVGMVLALATAMTLSACGGGSGNVRPDDAVDSGIYGNSGAGANSSGQNAAGGTAGQNGAGGINGNGNGNGSNGIDGGFGGAVSAAEEISLQQLENPENPLSVRTIYFNYNSTEIAADYQRVLAAHTQLLVQNPGVRIRLEGHTDERGSREYNIGLGNRRAESVSRLMQTQGAGSRQVDVVSYGEEKPARLQHNKAAWKLNRRVEIVYTRY